MPDAECSNEQYAESRSQDQCCLLAGLKRACTLRVLAAREMWPNLFRCRSRSHQFRMSTHQRLPSWITLDTVVLAPLGGAALLRKIGRYVPLTTIIGDDRHGFLVVACQHAFNLPAARRLKGNPVTDSELQHFRMRVHLGKKPQARDDAVVEINEFRLGQLIDIDLHRIATSRTDCSVCGLGK